MFFLVALLWDKLLYVLILALVPLFSFSWLPVIYLYDSILLLTPSFWHKLICFMLRIGIFFFDCLWLTALLLEYSWLLRDPFRDDVYAISFFYYFK